MNLNNYLMTFAIGLLIASGTIAQLYAQDAPSIIPPLSVETDLPVYSGGATVNISGKVKSLNENYVQPVIIRILDNSSAVVGIGQVIPDAQGDFSYQITAGGTWKVSGDYTILVNYGGQDGQNTFSFIGGEGVVKQPPPPPPPACGPDQKLLGGKCVDKDSTVPPPPTDCGDKQILVNGVCMDKEPDDIVVPVDCEPGESRVNGKCVTDSTDTSQPNGCFIATAAFGSELAPQVQFLREIRDNKVLTTSSGTSFMVAFNEIYYSFSPTIADWERESPMFKEVVKAFITPMISSLAIMSLADTESESDVLFYGISTIGLILGMYVVGPTVIAIRVRKYLKL